MYNCLLTVLSAFHLTTKVLKEKMEPFAPKGTRFDWDAYNADIKKGMSAMEQVKKQQRGGYLTTVPLPEKTVSIYDVVDWERYEHDKRVYGEAIAEAWRKNGSYKHKRY